MSALARRLRALEKRLVEQDQRIARMLLPATVKAVDPENYRVRLLLGTDVASGAEVLSPWVKWQSGSAGKVKDWSPPAEGEEMLLVSPSGVVGTGSRAMFGTFTDAGGDNPPPTDKGDERVWAFGDLRITTRGDRYTIALDEASIDIAGDAVSIGIGGKGFTISGDELAMTTRFRAKGGSRPAHYVTGLDSGGDQAVDGNADMLI